jgi:hypothetical protein
MMTVSLTVPKVQYSQKDSFWWFDGFKVIQRTLYGLFLASLEILACSRYVCSRPSFLRIPHCSKCPSQEGLSAEVLRKKGFFLQPSKIGSSMVMFLGLSMPPKTDFVSQDSDRTKTNCG